MKRNRRIQDIFGGKTEEFAEGVRVEVMKADESRITHGDSP